MTGLTTFQARVNLNDETHLHGDKRIYNYQADNNSANSGLMLLNRDYSDRRYMKRDFGNINHDLNLKNYKVFTTLDPDRDTMLARKKYIDDQDSKQVSKSGDSMTGDLDMQTNFIYSTAIPNDNSDLTNKKYVDDEDGKKVSKNGDTMSGNLNMGNNKIQNLKQPVDSKDAANRKYVDDANNLKLSLSGGTMRGNLDMNGYHIIHASNYTPSSNNHVVNKKYVTHWTLPNTVSNLYLLQMDDQGMFEIKDDVSNISYIGNSKKVNSLLNLSRKENWNLKQSVSNKKPFFKKSTVNNKFHCIQFPGSNSNNLNLNSSVNLLQSYLNVFVVYALKSKNASQNETCLFKINDRETSQTQVSNYYGVSFIQNKFCVTNAFPYEVKNWQTKANGFETNTLICLSSHWEQENLGNPKHGRLYVNGKEIHSFYTNFKQSFVSSTKFFLGSKSNNHGQFDGEIFYVYISTRKMKESEIVLNHYLLCKKFEIDFDEDAVIKYI